jgi:hypothetical protein
LRIAACHFPRQVLEAVGVEQRLLELPTLPVVHLNARRVADDLIGAAAEVGAGHWRLGPLRLSELDGLLERLGQQCLSGVAGVETALPFQQAVEL